MLKFLHFGSLRCGEPGMALRPISLKRLRVPPDVVRHDAWPYLEFTLSIRDVEELLAQRGVEVIREAMPCWATSLGR